MLRLKVLKALKEYGLMRYSRKEYFKLLSEGFDNKKSMYRHILTLNEDELEESILCYISPGEWYYKYVKC